MTKQELEEVAQWVKEASNLNFYCDLKHWNNKKKKVELIRGCHIRTKDYKLPDILYKSIIDRFKDQVTGDSSL